MSVKKKKSQCQLKGREKRLKKQTKNSKINWKDVIIGVIFILIGSVFGFTFELNISGKAEVDVEEVSEPSVVLSEDEEEGLIENDQGEIEEIEEIPTVEEVDGGQFEDETTGISALDGEYSDLGWSETYDTSSPTAFKNATLGKCINANNVYGAQCVSLARVFWWSYANRDVSTCGTGAAKGMMNCSEQNAGSDFEIHWAADSNSIQAGDWLVLNGGVWGHVAMALGPVHDGYVTVLGQNQGGALCAKGGAATNIINLSIKNLIGFYRPKSYIKSSDSEIKTSEINDNEIHYTYKTGDYFSKVLVELGLDEGNLWGENGTVKYYTQQLIEQGMLEHGDTGNVIIGKEFKLSPR